MKTWLGLALLALIALPGALRADVLPFLASGKWYQITAGKSIPLTAAGVRPDASTDFNIGWVQVLQPGNDTSQWTYVEFDRIDLPRDEKGEIDHRGQVTITKDRMWINFAQVTSVQPMDAPDYSKLMEKFTGGVKVVPYTPQ